MKKSLILAAAMAIGVSTSAYAATNSFSDVPSGHWAYDSIAKLAAAGVVEGYGDNTFCGDKLMTRYEMAQIVAKAMVKGAQVDKLSAEFADELNALGIRVAKLEKKSDNVKISGAVSMHYKAYTGKANKAYNGSNNFSRLRSDLNLDGTVNKNWTYHAMLRNEQRFDKGNKNSNEGTVDVYAAYVEGKIGGLKVKAGRYDEFLADGYIHDWWLDGVRASYGGEKLNIMAGYAQLENADTSFGIGFPGQHIFYAEANAALGKRADLRLGYYDLDLTWNTPIPFYDRKLMNAKLGLNLSDSLSVAYNFIHSSQQHPIGGGKRAHNLTLTYKEADPESVGSYGLEIVHYDHDSGTYLADLHTLEGSVIGFESGYGFKGWSISAGTTIAKNVVANVTWYDLQTKEPGKHDHAGTIYTDLTFHF